MFWYDSGAIESPTMVSESRMMSGFEFNVIVGIFFVWMVCIIFHASMSPQNGCQSWQRIVSWGSNGRRFRRQSASGFCVKDAAITVVGSLFSGSTSVGPRMQLVASCGPDIGGAVALSLGMGWVKEKYAWFPLFLSEQVAEHYNVDWGIAAQVCTLTLTNGGLEALDFPLAVVARGVCDEVARTSADAV